MSVSEGRLLGDRYRITERIASGGMGDVWRADDTVLGRPVAVKILRPEHAADPEFLSRFRNEARHAAALSHPNIAAVHDYGEAVDDGTTLAYLVMELVPGEPLSTLLARTGALPVERALDVVAQAADALSAAHQQGVIHRDVKPGNILVRPDGALTLDGTHFGAVALTDFGIAHATNEPGHLTRSGLVIGTAYYLSPEQARGEQVTPATDVYALGVVAYECLTGTRPFAGDNAVQVAVAHMRDDAPPLPDTIPAGVRDLVAHALAKDPAERPPDAAAFATAARAFRDDPALADTARLDNRATAASMTASAATTVAELSPGVERHDVRPRWRSDAYADQKRVRSLLLLAGLIVVVVGAVLLSLLGGRGDRPAVTQPSPSASPSPRVATVVVSEAAYVGRPYDEVRRDLGALGLAVHTRTLKADAKRDTVLAVDPHGSLPAHSSVTLTVAGGKSTDGHGKGSGND